MPSIQVKDDQKLLRNYTIRSVPVDEGQNVVTVYSDRQEKIEA